MSRIPTEKQNQVIHDKAGLFTVRACPGSGKTFTVAARLNHLLSDKTFKHQGIATISFTNVAWEEIQNYLTDEYGLSSSLGYPHFLGTIDRFINTYIFLPFGNLVMDCTERPTLSGPPHDNHEPIGNWLYWKNANCNQKKCRLSDFSYNQSDELIHLRNQNMGENCPHNTNRPCIQNKKIFNTSGYATQADANYFALKILNDFPQIATALAIRFPIIMVDEAQDTSRIQMMILDKLIDHGVEEMMLVGDPDQAIFEWRDAEPQLFQDKCIAWRDNSVELSDNWRSTQRICDFASKISSSTERMNALSPGFIETDMTPEIWGYSNQNDLPNILNKFLAYCGEYGILNNDVNILSSVKSS